MLQLVAKQVEDNAVNDGLLLRSQKSVKTIWALLLGRNDEMTRRGVERFCADEKMLYVLLDLQSYILCDIHNTVL